MRTQDHRYNIYSNIHKALRAFMADTLQRCGRTDWQDTEECRQTFAQLRGLMEVCHAHLHHEDQFVHAAMEARRPGSSMTTSSDHHEHVLAIKTFLTDVQEMEALPSAQRDAAGLSMYRRLALFVAENFEHMAVEETDNCAVLWACYTDEEIHGIEQRLVAAVPRESMGTIMRWMLPYTNAAERAAILGGMKRNVPAEAFDGVMAMIDPLLTTREKSKLDRALNGELPGAVQSAEVLAA